MIRRLLPLALVLSACGEDFTHVRFDVVAPPPTPPTLHHRQIRLSEGEAVAVRAVAMDGSEPMEDPPDFDLVPCRGNLGALPARDGTGDDLGDELDDWHDDWDDDDDYDPEEDAPIFVLWGAFQGSDCLRVVVHGDRDHEIPAIVGP